MFFVLMDLYIWLSLYKKQVQKFKFVCLYKEKVQNSSTKVQSGFPFLEVYIQTYVKLPNYFKISLSRKQLILSPKKDINRI